MTGKELKQKIKDSGYTLTRVANSLGISKHALQMRLDVKNVSTDTLERVAAAIGVSISYFYNEYPIFSIEDYVEIKSLQKEIAYLRLLLAEKDARLSEYASRSK